MAARERTMLIVLGVVLVASVGFFLLTRGGGGPEEAGPTVPPTAPTIPVPTTPPGEQPPRFTFFAGRDPFQSLIQPSPPPGPGPTPPPDVSPAPPGEEDDEQEGSTIGGHEVVLVDVFTSGGETLVQVQVDGQSYTVSVGETFAGNFQLVSVRGSCATFLFGDQSFTLCEPGERK